MDRVIIESPFKTSQIQLPDGESITIDEATNIKYALACARWCSAKGLASFASHLFYTQFLDDTDPAERELGIKSGFAWAEVANERLFFVDRGFSSGMVWGIKNADDLNQTARIIKLGGKWDLGWIEGDKPTWNAVEARLAQTTS
jgi:hypothetical protein